MRFSFVFAGALALCWAVVSVSFILWAANPQEFWASVLDRFLWGSLLIVGGYIVYSVAKKYAKPK